MIDDVSAICAAMATELSTSSAPVIAPAANPITDEPGLSATAPPTEVAPTFDTVDPASTLMPQNAAGGGGAVGADAPSKQPAKPASTIVLLINVMAPVDARRRPTTVAPALAETDADA